VCRRRDFVVVIQADVEQAASLGALVLVLTTAMLGPVLTAYFAPQMRERHEFL
jgi:hypothetical protein